MINQNTHHEQQRGLFEMTIAMLICGTIGITVLWSGQAATDLIFFRCLFGTLILGGICWYRGLFRQTQFTRMFWLASLIGGVALLANWYFLFSAYSKTSVGIATTVYNTQPFIFVLLSALVFKEKITLTILAWLGVSFVYPAVALLIDFAVLDLRLAWVQVIGILLILAGAAGNNLQGLIKSSVLTKSFK